MKTITPTKNRKRSKDISAQILNWVVGILIILPLIYALLMSFMPEHEILTTDLKLLPEKFYLGNYKIVFSQINILRFMLNSFIVAFVSSVVRLITAVLAAYAFAFYDFKGKKFLFALVIGSMIIPVDVLLIQNYFTVAGMGLINTYLGMMIVFFVSAMNIFVVRQTFLTYPKSIHEAAMVDGCSNFRFLVQILLPSTKSVLVTVFISSFVGTWNTYLWPLIVTNANEMRTAQVAITMLNVNEAGTTYGYGAIMAAAVIILIPSIVAFIIFQKKIVGGLTEGAVKG